ncbi:cell division protein FtsQ/DivIB [Luteimonas aquatica]|uniref:cell division protein FtsQ/DivIB n=1 Tax=Luteimonas aquatica TaxID=450364 RepID=UPI001F579DB6|nr:cell division protein FtsQ/DivIB [Luteimonas aquatica]
MSALLRLIAWSLAVALVALPVVAVLNGWIGAERWPLRTLRVAGELQRVDAQQLRSTVLPYARSGFFAVRLEQAQAAVAKLPWVEHAEVRKRWPDVLEVRIVEYRPFARWGEKELLSERGNIFPIGNMRVPPGLPRFDVDAPAARIKDVVALYNEAGAMFAAEGRKVSGVSLDRRGSWSLTLSNGTRLIVGSQEARLRLARFARLMPQLLASRPLPLQSADLRYTNGFALTWASGREQADAVKASAAADERPATDGRAGRSEARTAAPWMASGFPMQPGTTLKTIRT